MNARVASFFLTFAALMGLVLVTGRITNGGQALEATAVIALASFLLVALWTCVVRTLREVRVAWLTWTWMRRKARNQCLRCGYDLRGSPHRCPECGNVHDGSAGLLT